MDPKEYYLLKATVNTSYLKMMMQIKKEDNYSYYQIRRTYSEDLEYEKKLLESIKENLTKYIGESLSKSLLKNYSGMSLSWDIEKKIEKNKEDDERRDFCKIVSKKDKNNKKKFLKEEKHYTNVIFLIENKKLYHLKMYEDAGLISISNLYNKENIKYLLSNKSNDSNKKILEYITKKFLEKNKFNTNEFIEIIVENNRDMKNIMNYMISDNVDLMVRENAQYTNKIFDFLPDDIKIDIVNKIEKYDVELTTENLKEYNGIMKVSSRSPNYKMLINLISGKKDLDNTFKKYFKMFNEKHYINSRLVSENLERDSLLNKKKRL